MPVTLPLKRANATRLMLTAFSISSMPSRMPIVLRRVIDAEQADAEDHRGEREIRLKSHALLLRPREVDRAEQRRQHQHGEQLERQHEPRQHRRRRSRASGRRPCGGRGTASGALR